MARGVITSAPHFGQMPCRRWGLILMSVSGFVMWRRRKPQAGLGAPLVSHTPAKLRGIVLIIGILALFLPLLGASMLVMWAFERMVLPHSQGLAEMLGMRTNALHM